MQEKKTLDGVDLTKLIGSILVFSMHCSALESFGAADKVLEILARWAVPFFFIASGFFLFGKRDEHGRVPKETLIRYVKRIAMLYLCWLVINLPNVVYQRLWGKDLLAAGTWLDFLKGTVLASTFTGSWYLVSVLFSAWFVWLLSKGLKTGSVIAVTAVLYLLCILSCVPETLGLTDLRKGLRWLHFPLNAFNGCLFFALGKWISERKEKLAAKNHPMLYTAAMVCGLAYACEGLSVEGIVPLEIPALTQTDVSFFLVPVAVALFVLCLRSKRRFPRAQLMRRISTIIYCGQGNVLCVRGFLREYLHVRQSLALYLVSCVLMAAVIAAVLYIQEHKGDKWPWVRYLT